MLKKMLDRKWVILSYRFGIRSAELLRNYAEFLSAKLLYV